MAKSLRVFVLVFVVVSVNLFLPSQSQTDEFVYKGFKPSTSAASNNNTSISPRMAARVSSNGLLALTTASTWQIGRAFYPNPVRFKNSATGKAFSFSTAFAFTIVPKYPDSGGHGFAFVITPQMEFPGATPNQYLGIFNLSSNGKSSNHIFAVEFDTVVDVDFKDISDNHVGIDLNGLTSIDSVNASYFNDRGKKTSLRLAIGKTVQAWIDYNSTGNVVNVYLSLSSRKPETPIMSTRVDLAPVLLETMFVGFSGSMGQLTSSQFIRGWSFKMNGEAKSLDLASLPRIPRKHRNTGLIIGVVSGSAIVLIIVCCFGMVYHVRRNKKLNDEEVVEDWEVDIGPNRFSYKDLLQATQGFSDEELLGFGGFGRVYKGKLPNSNTQIAVKRISKESRQGLREFMSEIASMGRLRHRNLVHLLGWCRKGVDLLLVYDFMPNGSLDKYLFDEPKLILSWTQRFKIIKDVASGLLYLHEEWEQTVIHRDIKAGNVLLDTEMNGRLGDFGLAKLYEHGSNPSTTRVVGTLGYLAPELTRSGKPTKSSDVYAFGALLLEVVCGRRPIDAKALPEELILVEWVWEKWSEGAVLATVDPRLGSEYDEAEAAMVLKLGLMCSNSVPGKRPSMRQVVRYLEGEVALPEVVEPPDEFCKAGGGGGGSDDELECVAHSYPSSVSGFERASSWLLAPENDTIDIAAQVAMSLSSEMMNREDRLSN